MGFEVERFRWWLIFPIILIIYGPTLAWLTLSKGNNLYTRVDYILHESVSGPWLIAALGWGACLGIGFLLYFLYTYDYTVQLVAWLLPRYWAYRHRDVYKKTEDVQEPVSEDVYTEQEENGIHEQRERIQGQIQSSIDKQLQGFLSVREEGEHSV